MEGLVLKDFLGKAFAVGQRIVYPGRASSSLWMNAAVIEAVDEDKKALVVKPYLGGWRVSTSGAAKSVKLTALERVVVVEG